MRAHVLLVASLLGLAACGGADPAAACENYIAAVEACFTEGEGEFPLDDGYCSAYDNLSGSAAKDAADLLNCYADTIDAADCSSGESATSAFTALTTDCPGA